MIESGYHVLHEGKVALGLGWHAIVEPPVAIALCHLIAPLVQRERRIGYNPVEEHQLAVNEELGLPDHVALADIGVWQAMQEHVHLADAPGADVLLLAE